MADTTANRGYPIPDSTDAPRIYEDMQALGNGIDADVAAILTTYLTPVTDTSIGSAASTFTVVTMLARTLCNGKHVYIELFITTANAITATSGNFTDVTIFTLDLAYRPTESVNAIMGNGSTTGECTISSSDGTVVLRAASDTVGAGSNMRITATYIKS